MSQRDLPAIPEPGVDAPKRFECDVFAYGSLSGAGNFQILARTAGLTAEERRDISAHSSLVGSATGASNWHPIYAFYRAGDERFVLARTAFLGDGPRGADYLVRGIVLSAEALDAYRWDVAPLISGQEFLDSPEKPERLEPVVIAAAEADQESQRSAGIDLGGFGDAELDAVVLQAVIAGPVAMRARGQSAKQRLMFCLRLARYLPPEDRALLTFCTELSHSNGARFRFAIFKEADARVVERSMPEAQVLDRNALPPANQATAPFEEWMELVDGGQSPLFGLSLQREPAAAVKVAKFLKIPAGGEESGDLLGDEERQLAMVPDASEQLLRIRRDPRNDPWPEVRQSPVTFLVRFFTQRLYALLERLAENPWVALFSDAPVEVLAPDVPAGSDRTLIFGNEDLLALGKRLERVQEVRPFSDDYARFGAASCALVFSYSRHKGTAPPLFGDLISLFAAPQTFLRWIVAMDQRSKIVTRDVLTEWMSGISCEDRFRCLSLLINDLRSLRSPKEQIAATLAIFAAFESATAKSGDDSQQRTDWRRVSEALWPRVIDVLPKAFAIRVAFQHSLLNHLPAGTIEWLAEPLLIQFGKRLRGLESLSFSVREGLARQARELLKTKANDPDPKTLASLRGSCGFLVRQRCREFPQPFEPDDSTSDKLFGDLFAYYKNGAGGSALVDNPDFLEALLLWPRNAQLSDVIGQMLVFRANNVPADRGVLQNFEGLIKKYRSRTISGIRGLKQIMHSIEFEQRLEKGTKIGTKSGTMNAVPRVRDRTNAR